jgi:hypothetical protein
VSSLSFAPASPVWITLLLAVMALLAAGLVVWRLGRSGWWRAVLGLILALYLAQPVWRTVVTAPGKNIALMITDTSASMSVDGRGRQASRALSDIRKKYPAQKWHLQNAGTPADPATRLENALSGGLSRIAPEDLSGVVILTDGIIHDAAALARFKSLGKPVNVLLTGDPDLIDRKLTVVAAPPFALVGQQAKLTVRLDDAASAPPAQLTWRVGDIAQKPVQLVPGQNTVLAVPVSRRGRVDVILSVPPRTGEITTDNNQALVQLNGVRDRLQVLLVSGAPYPGGRLWRDTLKSDPSIDLIHFTILRLPSSFDVTPNSELSLIPFPVDQLFEQRLNSFDLIVFDSFGALDLLDPGYFANVSDFVKRGGALFVVAGPEFGSSESLSSTALADILPLRPMGIAEDVSYRPERTREGLRHPISASLPTGWGPWFQQGRVKAVAGTTLMTGARQQPLLQIADVGKGRVGIVAANQLWVWARGDPPGPWAEVTRRMSHWLMREPDLEAEKLAATSDGKKITVVRTALIPAAGTAQVTAPDNSSQTVEMTPTSTGARGEMISTKPGVYRVMQDGLSAAVLVGGNTPERRDVRPTDKRLAPLATATGGKLAWLKDGTPSLAFSADARTRITGTRSTPLLPAWLALLLSVGVAAAMWIFERK